MSRTLGGKTPTCCVRSVTWPGEARPSVQQGALRVPGHSAQISVSRAERRSARHAVGWAVSRRVPQTGLGLFWSPRWPVGFRLFLYHGPCPFMSHCYLSGVSAWGVRLSSPGLQPFRAGVATGDGGSWAPEVPAVNVSVTITKQTGIQRGARRPALAFSVSGTERQPGLWGPPMSCAALRKRGAAS